MKEFMAITDLQDEYVVCRTVGHAWDDNPGAQLNGDMWKAATAGMALRCTRCFTERFDYIGKDMKVFGRYYRYPEHYTTIPGEGTRPNLRGEMFRRSLLIRRKRAR
jgi:hypothetical protein